MLAHFHSWGGAVPPPHLHNPQRGDAHAYRFMHIAFSQGDIGYVFMLQHVRGDSDNDNTGNPFNRILPSSAWQAKSAQPAGTLNVKEVLARRTTNTFDRRQRQSSASQHHSITASQRALFLNISRCRTMRLLSAVCRRILGGLAFFCMKYLAMHWSTTLCISRVRTNHICADRTSIQRQTLFSPLRLITALYSPAFLDHLSALGYFLFRFL